MPSQPQPHPSQASLQSLILENHYGLTPLIKARIPSQITKQILVQKNSLMFQTGSKVPLMLSVRERGTKVQEVNKMTKMRIARRETIRILQLFFKRKKVSCIKPR